MEFEISFTDTTILESNGEFDKVVELMNEDIVLSDKWVIRSDVTIISPMSMCKMECSFYNTGKVYITRYMPMTKDMYNPDIRFLNYWCNEKGWKRPEPLPRIISDWEDFWKKEWQTWIVDSEYFDSQYGQRKDMEEIEIEDEEDDEI